MGTAALGCPVTQGLPRPRRKPCLLPQLVPLPNPTPSLRRQPISQLVRQHDDLPPMMRLMREHVRKHRPAGGPHRHPTPARKFRHSPPLRIPRQRLSQHPQTLLPTLLVGGRRLLHRAPRRIERRRTFQMRRRILQPHQPAVMHMREDRPNCLPCPFGPGGSARHACGSRCASNSWFIASLTA